MRLEVRRSEMKELTASSATNFPAMLDAALSMSTCPGSRVRNAASSFLTTAECFVTEAAVVRSDVFASDAFHPDSTIAERLLEAVLTARIDDALRSSGEGSVALSLPFEFEMVNLEASLSARSSGERVAAFGLVDEAAREWVGRVLVAGDIAGRV